MIRQRTSEWYEARLGKFTASHFSELMAKPAGLRTKWSKTAMSYIQDLALQLFLNEYTFRPDNDATRWGMRNEDLALSEFGRVTGFDIEESGFMIHPVFPEAGATPDAFIRERKLSSDIILAQVKCPFSQKNHLRYIRKIHDAETLRKSTSAIHWQIQGEIWVTGAAHSYFVTFDPRKYGIDRLHYAKIERDQKAIDMLEIIIPEAVSLRNEFFQKYISGELCAPRLNLR
jgi:hypothetical protein